MYAIIQDGAHQYKVEEGDTLEVQRRDLAEGQDTVEFDRVLLVADGEQQQIGRPVVDGAKVRAKVVDEVKGDKLIIMKIRPAQALPPQAGAPPALPARQNR